MLSVGGAICNLGTESSMVGSRTLNEAPSAKQYNTVLFLEFKNFTKVVRIVASAF